MHVLGAKIVIIIVAHATSLALLLLWPSSSLIFKQGMDANVYAQEINQHQLQKGQQPQAQSQATFAFQKSSFFIDESNILHLNGEVKNISNKAMKNVVVKASFYDVSGRFLKVFQSSTDVRTVNPGEISPFEILYIDPGTATTVKDYILTAAGQETENKTSALRIVSSNSKLDLLGTYYIAGRVVNDGSQDATNSMVIASLYDKGGKVVVVGRAQTEPVNISSHSQAAFDIPVTEKSQTYKVKSYSLIADSDQYVVVPEFSHLTVIIFFILTMAVVVVLSKIKPTTSTGSGNYKIKG
jgi:hypothetical protein